MISLLAKLLSLLSDNSDVRGLSLAVGFAWMMGFNPLLSIVGFVTIFLLFAVRINLSMFLLAWPLFALISSLFFPIYEPLGYWLLSHESLQPFYQAVYQQKWFLLSQYHYSAITGAMLFSVISLPIISLVAFWLIKQYQQKLLAYIAKLKVVKALKASSWGQKLLGAYQLVKG